MSIEKNIKDRRRELGLTLKDVADALGVAESTVSRYESSDIKHMGIDKIEVLAKVLKTTPGHLMGWEDEEKGEIEDNPVHDPNFAIVYDAWPSMTEDDKKLIADLAKRIKNEDLD